MSIPEQDPLLVEIMCQKLIEIGDSAFQTKMKLAKYFLRHPWSMIKRFETDEDNWICTFQFEHDLSEVSLHKETVTLKSGHKDSIFRLTGWLALGNGQTALGHLLNLFADSGRESLGYGSW